MDNLSKLLTPLDLDLDQLLLDPNNPRFAELGEEIDVIPESRISEKKVQDKAYEKMLSPRFDVNELRDTIKTIGYLPMDRIVVRSWKGGSKTKEKQLYVVIEGNRRVAALKWLIELHEGARETFSKEQLDNFNHLPALLLDVEKAPESVKLILLRKSAITHTLTGKYRTVRGEESAGDGIVL